ncbi:recombinase family protein [Streptomyces sp. NPDC046985]|uniref:recombinase family protein n=1 Tax=Streptomyces sp. NPDC046985 TaxID=3155377 RepID=UPI003401B198
MPPSPGRSPSTSRRTPRWPSWPRRRSRSPSCWLPDCAGSQQPSRNNRPQRAETIVHEHKRLGRGIELAALAEELKAGDIGLEFVTGELQGSHDSSGVVFTVLAALSGMEREYIRDRTLEGHESARKRGKTIGGAGVVDNHMLSMALHLRDIAAQLVISKGTKKGEHPSPATVMRMLREHDEQAATAAST